MLYREGTRQLSLGSEQRRLNFCVSSIPLPVSRRQSFKPFGQQLETRFQTLKNKLQKRTVPLVSRSHKAESHFRNYFTADQNKNHWEDFHDFYMGERAEGRGGERRRGERIVKRRGAEE